MDFERDSVIEFFRNHDKVFVRFEKTDGSIRDMTCTRNTDFIPIGKHPKGDIHKVNEEVLPVFDLEKNEWRSFRFDSLKECYSEF